MIMRKKVSLICKDNNFKQTGLNAGWRNARMTAIQFMETLMVAGLALSPLLALPGFKLDFVVLDWLHIVDLGLGADLLGNLFYEVTHSACVLFPANSKEYRLDQLWEKMQKWYKAVKPASRLDNLTFEMFTGKNGKPKLRAKGGECRYLIPFGALLAGEIASAQSTPHNHAVARLFYCLVELQKWVSGDYKPYDSDAASLFCRQVCILYSALHVEATNKGKPNLWDMKPKVHLFQELIEYQSVVMGNPRHFWCYRDESWCGYWAKASKRRGGANTVAMTAERFLDRYRALEQDDD